MNKRIITALSALVMAASVFAQTTKTEFKTRYDNQVKRVGYSGLGVESILDKWEAAFPDDEEMLAARFSYYLEKSQTLSYIQKSESKYLGSAPVLTLKDSLGTDVNYFEDTVFDDELFGKSSSYVEKLIKMHPERLDYRFLKLTSLIAYEKDSPDMFLSAISGLVDYNYTLHPKWMYEDETVSESFFSDSVLEYCSILFTIASPNSYEAFRKITEQMLKYEPKNASFTADLGSYYLVNKDFKMAKKYYDKALKLDPSNYSAIKNGIILARNQKDVKLEKKYLAMMVKYSTDETERESARVKLESLNKK